MPSFVDTGQKDNVGDNERNTEVDEENGVMRHHKPRRQYTDRHIQRYLIN